MLKQAIIARLPFPERGNSIVYDCDVKGFGVRTTAKGSRSFVLTYRFKGQQRRYTIGSCVDWKLSAARERAKELKRGLELGIDPLVKRQSDRLAPTVSQLADRYIAEYLPRKRASSQIADKGLIKQFIRPTIGSRKVADITSEDAESLHRDISEGKRTKMGRPSPIRANRCIAVLSKMFSQAIRWRIIDANPCRGIEKNPENTRRRYFSHTEIVAISKALDSYPAQIAANCIRLIMLTGCRPGEARLATWDQFDLERRVWVKSGTITKQKIEHRVPLSAPALELLRRMRKENPDTVYVFHGRRKTQPITQIRSVWDYVREATQLKDARIHDLRHTYASILASGGLSLPIIGALLGHTQPQTTARYAHLYDEPLIEATEAAGRFIMSAANEAAETL